MGAKGGGRTSDCGRSILGRWQLERRQSLRRTPIGSSLSVSAPYSAHGREDDAPRNPFPPRTSRVWLAIVTVGWEASRAGRTVSEFRFGRSSGRTYPFSTPAISRIQQTMQTVSDIESKLSQVVLGDTKGEVSRFCAVFCPAFPPWCGLTPPPFLSPVFALSLSQDKIVTAFVCVPTCSSCSLRLCI